MLPTVWIALLPQLFGAPYTSDLIAAPSGSRVAWVSELRGARTLFVADGPDFAPRAVTATADDDGRAYMALVFSGDGKTLFYVLGTEAGTGGELKNPAQRASGEKDEVVALDVATGRAETLAEGALCPAFTGCTELAPSPDGARVVIPTRGGFLYAERGSGKKASPILAGVRRPREPRWSPDGKALAFVSDRGGVSLIGVWTAGGERVRWLAPALARDGWPRWSPDGQTIAFARRVAGDDREPLLTPLAVPWGIWIADVATGDARPVWQSGSRVVDSFPREAPASSFGFGAGGELVFPSEADGWLHLYAVGREGRATPLTPGAFEVAEVSFAADRRSLLVASNQGDLERRHVFRVPLDGGGPRALTGGDGVEWSPVETAGGRAVLCLGATATTPGQPLLVGKGPIAAPLAPAAGVVPRTVTFAAADGSTVHAQLFEPRSPARRPAPAVIYLHGGPNRQMFPAFHPMRYYHEAYALNQQLAGRGFVVLAVNYRLGVGYGQAFREPPGAAWRGAAELADVVAAAEWLRARGARRIGVWGGSYGGYLTALALARRSDLFAAGVDMHGVHDWLRRFDGTHAEDRERFEAVARAASPISAVASWRSPVLFISGDDDDNVDVKETLTLMRLLRERGVPFESLLLPDEPHFFHRHESWARIAAAITRFFEARLISEPPSSDRPPG